MSHDDHRTGVLELTITQADAWFKRKYEELPSGILSHQYHTMMHFYADLLKHHGLQVSEVQPDCLRVKATPETVQAVLGRQTPNPVEQQ